MRKIGLALCSGAATLALLAGCSQGAGGSTAQQQPAAGDGAFTNIAMLADTVSTKQTAAKTGKFQLTGSMGGDQIRGNGALDVSNPSAPAMQTNMQVHGQQMTVVLKDKVVYMKVPQAGGKPWVKVDSNGKDPMSKMFGKMFSQMNNSADPTKALEQFKNAGKITGSKEETVNGEHTTHYSIQLDTKKVMQLQMDQMKQAFGGQVPGDMQSEMDKMTAKMPPTLPAELWINDQQLPVKYAMTMPMPTPSPSGNGGPQKVTMTANYTDWGKPVTITVPPAGQVEDIAQKMREFTHLGG